MPSFLKEFCHFAFFSTPNITQPFPRVFSVNGSIICSRLTSSVHFSEGCTFDVIGSIFGQQQLVMVNYTCGFNQSETGKYFEWIIISNYWMRLGRIWRILQIKEGVIHRGRRSRWITPSENCFIIHSKYFLLLKGVSPLSSLFFRSPNITQPCPQVFSVNGSIICGGLHFWRHFGVIGSIILHTLHFWHHWFNMAKILSKSGEQQQHACKTSAHAQGLYFQIGGCECELHNKNACFWAEIELY